MLFFTVLFAILSAQPHTKFYELAVPNDSTLADALDTQRKQHLLEFKNAGGVQFLTGLKDIQDNPNYVKFHVIARIR